jgi:hypothetical protein
VELPHQLEHTNYRPRSYEPIGFAELRALASGHDISNSTSVRVRRGFGLSGK